MKVILKENIKSIGKKDEVVNVSDGYARNYLFAKNLAVEATPGNLAKLQTKKDSATFKKSQVYQLPFELLLFLDDREAEIAELLPELEILAVCKRREPRLVKPQLAALVDEALVHADADHVGDEHIV